MPALDRFSGRHLLLISGGLFVAGMVLLAAGVFVFARSRSVPSPTPVVAASVAASAVISATRPEPGSLPPSWSSTTVPSVVATASPPAKPIATPPAASPPPAAAASTRLAAYQGLGSWVDIYDDSAWRDPAATVADMAKHGVRTLHIETGNSRSSGQLFKPAELKQFITEAHARDMRVVAWYLPDLKDLDKDFGRIDAAIKLTTADGQKFDSFELDIESGAVTPESKRNRALLTLSTRIRDSVGPAYPLGAIIPSPVGLSRKGSYWSTFPYSDLARIYDVFVPMGYYTYHGDGAKLALSDTLGNARILRAQKGCSAVPIHMIGGEAEKSSAAEVAAFVRGVREARCIGASLYGWAGTKPAHWQELTAVGSGPQ